MKEKENKGNTIKRKKPEREERKKNGKEINLFKKKIFKG